MIKQVIAVRADLRLSQGKLAVQAAHASLESYRRAEKKTREAWEDSGAKKVVVKVPDLKALFELQERARKLGLPHALIRDAGRTELAEGTVTALGIGPAESVKMDRATRDLKLL